MCLSVCVAGAVAASSQVGVLLSAVRGSRSKQSSEERRPPERSLPVQRPAYGKRCTLCVTCAFASHRDIKSPEQLT